MANSNWAARAACPPSRHSYVHKHKIAIHIHENKWTYSYSCASVSSSERAHLYFARHPFYAGPHIIIQIPFTERKKMETSMIQQCQRKPLDVGIIAEINRQHQPSLFVINTNCLNYGSCYCLISSYTCNVTLNSTSDILRQDDLHNCLTQTAVG